MSGKIDYVNELRDNARELATIKRGILDKYSVYFSRGYNSGGSDPIEDSDIAAIGVTAADVTAWITLLEQFERFLGNLSVIQANYQATVDVMRNDV